MFGDFVNHSCHIFENLLLLICQMSMLMQLYLAHTPPSTLVNLFPVVNGTVPMVIAVVFAF
jgi:hypothetical protein